MFLNRDILSLDEVKEISDLVRDPQLKSCRADYSREKRENFGWIFECDPIGGSSSALKELMRLAVIGKEAELGQST